MYVHQKPKAVDEDDLRLSRLIDEEYTGHPFYGTRRMVVVISKAGGLLRLQPPPSPSLPLPLPPVPLPPPFFPCLPVPPVLVPWASSLPPPPFLPLWSPPLPPPSPFLFRVLLARSAGSPGRSVPAAPCPFFPCLPGCGPPFPVAARPIHRAPSSPPRPGSGPRARAGAAPRFPPHRLFPCPLVGLWPWGPVPARSALAC